MVPKRSRQDVEEVSPMKLNTKQKISLALSIVSVLRSSSEAFLTMVDFKRYLDYFYRREIVFG